MNHVGETSHPNERPEIHQSFRGAIRIDCASIDLEFDVTRASEMNPGGVKFHSQMIRRRSTNPGGVTLSK